ncbi:MAG TPA: hypothetical protein PKX25_17350 [Microthrixaceae bacterium]|nr:hypothetical protein [Microthrixaceae bacterium]
MVAVSLIREGAEGEAPLWTGYLALPDVGAILVIDGSSYEVVSHRYELSAGAVWQGPIVVVIRAVQA